MDHILVEGFPLGDCVNGGVLSTSTNMEFCREHTRNNEGGGGQKEGDGVSFGFFGYLWSWTSPFDS